MNKRQYYRLELTTFCSVRLRKLGCKTLSVGEVFEGEIQNISGGGLCFLVDRDLPVNTYFLWQFLIELPHDSIDICGELVWKKADEDFFMYGVKFVFLDDLEQQRLISQINNLQIRLKEHNHSIG